MTDPRQNLRADSALALYFILEQGRSSREVLAELQPRHSDKDRAWMQEMVFGVLRHLPLLQYWLRELLEKPLKANQKVIEQLIMLGFYQLTYSRVSTHAAVSETVAGCHSLGLGHLKGLVNAVLRNFIRQQTAETTPDVPHITHRLPKWLYKRLAAAYPESLAVLSEAMLTKPPVWLRVNTRQLSRSDYLEALPSELIDSVPETHGEAIVLKRSSDITALPGYQQGWFAVQDGAAQLAAHYLDAQAGESVLDCCAAPGGKTCHILERTPSVARCVALDIDNVRLARIEENLSRLQHHAELVCGDASQPGTWWDGQQFDRILLDAPCSATGVIRRHPDIKWLRKGADIAVLVALQEQILQAMWGLLKPGGTLLYATCSILPEENAQQITRFLNNTANASLSAVSDTESCEQPGRQILPGEQQMDGFYYARLVKSAT